MSAISATIGGDTSAKSHELPRTRLSLYYLVGYTLPVGAALMFVPQMTMSLLLTNHAYDDLGLRMFGVLLFSLGMLASGLIVNKASSVIRGRCLCAPSSSRRYSYFTPNTGILHCSRSIWL